MIIRGQISDGEVQADGKVPLPNGTRVIIVPEGQTAPLANGPSVDGHRVRLPLVVSESPASVTINSQRIGEILDDSASP
ncbi:MAG: hypothetical protein AAGD11_03290 [Planctomycetota bacterium]